MIGQRPDAEDIVRDLKLQYGLDDNCLPIREVNQELMFFNYKKLKDLINALKSRTDTKKEMESANFTELKKILASMPYFKNLLPYG